MISWHCMCLVRCGARQLYSQPSNISNHLLPSFAFAHEEQLQTLNMAALPAKLKTADLQRFAVRAAQLEKYKPIVTYWLE